MGLLSGKRFLITGLLSDRSIAAGIAAALHREGAELAFSYAQDRFEQRVRTLAATWNGAERVYLCDVQSDDSIRQLVESIQILWPEGLDGFIHSIAFAPADQLQGDYLNSVNREGFRIAHDVSAYSFSALAQAFRDLLIARRGSLLTLSYLGAERAIPHYNVMGLAKASLEASVRYLANDFGPLGVRVNAISAGPIRTLAASGIQGMKDLLSRYEAITPLRRNVTQEEVGDVAAFLLSPWASAITGEVLHVDSGFHAIASL